MLYDITLFFPSRSRHTRFDCDWSSDVCSSDLQHVATGLDVLARLADTSVAALLELNPQFVRGITPPGRGVIVRVPRGSGAAVAERYADLPVNERITFVDHYVTYGQTLSSIAQRYKVTVTMLQAANPRLRTHALRVGQRVIVPMSGRVVPRGDRKSVV